MGLSCSDREANNEADGDGYLSADDIQSLHSQGHHIACHTFSHYRLSSGTVEELVADAQKNVALLEELLDAGPIRHFSYPFGDVNFQLKRQLSLAYDTLRSSRPGINQSIADLNLLRATSIYNPSFSHDSLLKTIDKAAQLGGWLIFYTHGVDAIPNDYGCTPAQLEWVIEQCTQRNMPILPISSAYAAVTGS